MSITNPSFELAGAQPGDASGWTRTVVSTYEEIAGFGALNAPLETFEVEWGNEPVLFEFADADVARAIYTDPTPPNTRNAEGFEVLWGSNEGFQFELTSTEDAVFGATSFEPFETGWGNDAFLFGFSGPDVAAAPTEDFESGWLNTIYLYAFTNPDLSAALFYVGAQPRENFETVFPLRAYTPDVTVNAFASTAHGFANGDVVQFTGDGAVPRPFQVGIDYFVRDVTANALRIAASAGGAALVLTDSGSGQRQLQASTSGFWTLAMTTL